MNVQRSNKSILKSTDATQSNYDRWSAIQTVADDLLSTATCMAQFFFFLSLSDTFVFFISFICSHFFIIHGCRWIISFYLEVIRFVFSCKTDNFRCVYAGAIKMNKQLTLNVSHAINCFHFFRVKFSNNWKTTPKYLRKMRNLTMNVSELGKNVNITTTYREKINWINLRNDKRWWILSRLQVKICVTFFSLA